MKKTVVLLAAAMMFGTSLTAAAADAAKETAEVTPVDEVDAEPKYQPDKHISGDVAIHIPADMKGVQFTITQSSEERKNLTVYSIIASKNTLYHCQLEDGDYTVTISAPILQSNEGRYPFVYNISIPDTDDSTDTTLYRSQFELSTVKDGDTPCTLTKEQTMKLDKKTGIAEEKNLLEFHQFEGKLGDTDNDGQISETDAVSVLLHFANAMLDTEYQPDAAELARGDIDSNGTLDDVDAVLILRYFAETVLGQTPKWSDLLGTSTQKVYLGKMLTPDATLSRAGVKINQYYLTEHNVNHMDMPQVSMKGKIIGVTVHNTDWVTAASGSTPAEQYTRATLNDNMGTVRVHYYCDNTCAWQNLPLTLSGWHAADGHGDGNRKTISIECIMSSNNKDRDKKSEDNCARLAASLLRQNGLDIDHLYTHTHWLNVKAGKTGTVDELNVMKSPTKYCPAYILPHWQTFKDKVAAYMEKMDDNGEFLQ